MGSYVAPALWLVIGVLGMVTTNLAGSERVLERRRREQREQLRQTFDSRLHIVLTGAIAVLCLLATMRSIWRGSDAWWLWLAATASQLGTIAIRERTARRFFAYVGEPRGPRSAQERARQVHLLGFSTIAVVALIAAQVLMPDVEAADPGTGRVNASLALFGVAAALAALGAGWSSVWLFKTHDDERPSPPSRRSG